MASLFLVINFMHYCFPSYSGLQEQIETFWLMDGPVTSHSCGFSAEGLLITLGPPSRGRTRVTSCGCRALWDGWRRAVLPCGAPDRLAGLCSCPWHSFISPASRCCSEQKTVWCRSNNVQMLCKTVSAQVSGTHSMAESRCTHSGLDVLIAIALSLPERRAAGG